MRESKYNKQYKEIRKESIPIYLKESKKKKKWRRVARFRLGNEIRERKYWIKERQRLCRVCDWKRRDGSMFYGGVGEKEKRLEETKETQERVKEILTGDGIGEGQMRTLEEEKNKGGDERRDGCKEKDEVVENEKK